MLTKLCDLIKERIDSSLSSPPLSLSLSLSMSTNNSCGCSSKRGTVGSGDGYGLATFFCLCRPDPASEAASAGFRPMLSVANLKLRRLCSRLRWGGGRRPKPGSVAVRTLGRSMSGEHLQENGREPSAAFANGRSDATPTVRIATFNAAMFSMAPAVPRSGNLAGPSVDAAAVDDLRSKSANDRRPKGILKQRSYSKSKLRVSINLPDNEISLERGKQQLNYAVKEDDGVLSRIQRGKAPMASSPSFSSAGDPATPRAGERSVLEVLREVGPDVVALQNVRAEEEKGMSPLSDLAQGLGMAYVFAESWAPDYGNAILSRWPIKKWKVQNICDDTDFRNVLKATIDVPRAGEVNIHCTYLDHLDEGWRMKQINSILQSSEGPHILAGGLNSLDESDYSSERWNDIVRYYEEIGKPTPRVEVMKLLKGKQFVDAKDFAGECEAIVVVAKGQDVQGTCKYGTRVDYVLASPDSPYRFVPGSYAVFSSKGTSDHHIVKVDVKLVEDQNDARRQSRRTKPKVVKINMGRSSPSSTSSRGIWRTS